MMGFLWLIPFAWFGWMALVAWVNGSYDPGWPAVHMSPEETVQAFEELGARVLFPVHNSTFDLAFHRWRDPLERVAKLAEQRSMAALADRPPRDGYRGLDTELVDAAVRRAHTVLNGAT